MPVAVHVLGLAIFAQGTSEMMLAGLLPELSADLDVGIPQAGLLISGRSGSPSTPPSPPACSASRNTRRRSPPRSTFPRSTSVSPRARGSAAWRAGYPVVAWLGAGAGVVALGAVALGAVSVRREEALVP